jgi:hypothetical protein
MSRYVETVNFTEQRHGDGGFRYNHFHKALVRDDGVIDLISDLWIAGRRRESKHRYVNIYIFRAESPSLALLFDEARMCKHNSEVEKEYA